MTSLGLLAALRSVVPEVEGIRVSGEIGDARLSAARCSTEARLGAVRCNLSRGPDLETFPSSESVENRLR